MAETVTAPRPAPFSPREGPRRILAIDGGGMRGALAVGLLAELEEALRQKTGDKQLVLSDYFDLIGGTSTGAIIAAGLALGKDTDYLRGLYRKLGPEVFHHLIPRLMLIQSKFDPRKLERVIRNHLGDYTLGDAPWRCGFASVSKRVDTASCWVLTNCPNSHYWNGNPKHPETLPNKDYKLATIVQASAAAPYYFDMVRMEVSKGDLGVFFDGAMTPHGNPALQLAMVALIPGYGVNWTAGANNLMIVSVGTGSPRPRKPAWAKRPLAIAAWKAAHALTTVAYDNSQLSTSVLQWLGASPQRWEINRDVGDLRDDMPAGDPFWTFVRYDAPLEVEWMQEHLHRTYAAKDLQKLARLDDYRLVPELFEIGQAAGAALIKPEHFI